MRIIAGKYRGRKLKSPPLLQTRPTSDRLRETLFNILAPRVDGARFLDLCAGSGAVGIEALSRGASRVAFVDRSRRMCALIDANVKELEVDEDQVEIVGTEAAAFLKTRAKRESATSAGEDAFDFVFFDPPYSEDYETVLEFVGRHPALLASDGVMIVEHYRKNDLNGEFGLLHRYRIVKQGDSSLSFYAR
jgi:16S rRNA (guanine(966)-N(2))-methyltransferase RsmD